MSDPNTTPTLPKLTNLADRSGLVSAMTVLEAIQARSFTLEACGRWIRETFALEVESVGERGVGLLSLRGSIAPGHEERFQRLADAARAEVVRTLRGLISRPQNDAFLSKALLAQRVRRESVEGKTQWVPHVEATDSLSELLLALFIADTLSYRDTYDARLSICDVCSRVTFVERRGARYGCFEHPLR